MSQNSVILKLIALPIAIFVSCMGIMTILGGHITPGGGFSRWSHDYCRCYYVSFSVWIG